LGYFAVPPRVTPTCVRAIIVTLPTPPRITIRVQFCCFIANITIPDVHFHPSNRVAYLEPARSHDSNPIPDRVRRKDISGFLQTTLSKVARHKIVAHDRVCLPRYFR
jgi:hypothetical protein